MMTWSQIGFQDRLSPIMEEFIFFNDFIILILMVIIVFVGFIIISRVYNSYINTNLVERQILECI